MALESALVKPVADAIMALLRRGENLQLNRNAEKAVRDAIRELLLASPDENKAAARIAVAKAAGLLSEEWCWPKACWKSTARPRRKPPAGPPPAASASRHRPSPTTRRPRRNPSPRRASLHRENPER